MELDSIIDLILQQGIWAALFVWLFATYKKESAERESQLRTEIKDNQNSIITMSKEFSEQMSKVSENLNRQSEILIKMEQRLDNIEDELKKSSSQN